MRAFPLFFFASVALSLFACSSEPITPVPTGSGGGGGDPTTTGDGGSGGISGSGGDGGAGGALKCPALALSQTNVSRKSIGAYGIEARVAPEVPGAFKTRANFELYEDDGSGLLPPLQTGTFDLAKPPNDNYGTCQHCALLVTYDHSDQPTRVFFQSEGSLVLSKLDPNDRTIGAGVLEDVTLVEVTQDPDFSWHVIPDGPCFTIPKWSFDTTPIDGLPCTRAEDCPNDVAQLCEPKTGKCGPLQCSFTGDVPCAQDEICMAQVPEESSWGACYRTCTPFTSDVCPFGSECIPLGPTQQIGACRPRGTAAIGAPCDESDISTGCVQGGLCVGNPAVCGKICSYLTADPGCPSGTVCGLQNVCVPKSSADPTPIGGTCLPDTPPTSDCGADDQAFRGLCISLFPDVPVLTCQRTCNTNAPECPGGQYCAGVFENPTIGICWPDPVCGNGEVDILNEVCDDGNTVSNDGCSSDCKSAELGPLCAEAEALVTGQTLQGTTLGGPTGYVGSCQLYSFIPAKTYSFLPPGPGTLSLTLGSTLDMDLAVLGDCADAATELGCHADWKQPERLEIKFSTTPAKPVLIVVRGHSTIDVGAFQLDAIFTPAVCGDGLVAGAEACDDGNQTGNDGCSADCGAIEWPIVCAGLPLLSTTAMNTGDTTGGKNLITSDGSCATFLGSDNEAMFRFTAPSNGTLSLTLPEKSADFALSVIDGCGAWSEVAQLFCSNGSFPPEGVETLSVELTAGQLITVVVDGFRPGEKGPFSLQASFQ